MMYITFAKLGERPTTIEFHIGEKILPMTPERGKVVIVQADGDELDYIKRNFSNIPFHKDHRVQTWIGDPAMFIATNW